LLPAFALIISPQDILAPPKFLGVLTDLQIENPVRGPPRMGFFRQGSFQVREWLKGTVSGGDMGKTFSFTVTGPKA
jgi:hypothetical protein